MTFSASLLNMATYLGPGHATTVHTSGAVAKAGLFLAGHHWEKMRPALGIPWCFFAGALAAGFSTSRAGWKTLDTCAAAMVLVGVLACVAGALMEAEHGAAIYVAGFAGGVQNAMITTITGFVRSTHTTGTITDIGLLLGQAWPNNWDNAAHWWKTKILILLVVAWYGGGVCAEFIHDAAEGKLAYVSGGISLAVGLYGTFHCQNSRRKAARAVAAEETAAAAEEAKAAAEAAAALAAVVPGSGGRDVESGAVLPKKPAAFKRIVKRNVMVVNQGMDALIEISREMAGNINSMPDPPEKVVATVMAVNKAAKLFKMKSRTRMALQDPNAVSEEDATAMQAMLGAVCAFLVERAPEVVQQLEQHTAGAGSFVAAAAVPHVAASIPAAVE